MIQFVDSHIGLLVFVCLFIVVLVLWSRGSAPSLFSAIREMLSERNDDGTLTLSTKRGSMMVGLSASVWAFVKITLAVCRWIDAKGDPTIILALYAMTLAAVTGSTTTAYLLGKKLDKQDTTPGVPNAQQ